MGGETTAKLKQASIMCLEGFKEACCLHRVVILCYRSRSLLLRTVPCFLLNGFIFLGSVLVLNSFVIPVLQWILPDHCPHISYQAFCASGTIMAYYSILRAGLTQLFYLFWFYPLYIFSLILSTIWYSDIANQGFNAKRTPTSEVAMPAPSLRSSVHQDRPAGLGGVVIGIGEQLYSILLLSFFFLEVYAAGLIPYAGKALNFLLLSWMYAYYCFEYKWNLSGVPLDKRLDIFESNWAFFAGFGCPCVLAVFLFPPLESYAVMATLFPLFVLAATKSDADIEMQSQRNEWRCSELGRLPVFCVADTLSMKVLSFVHFGPREHTLSKSL